MTSDSKDGKRTAERRKKTRAKVSGAGNAKEASDARAKSVRGIMDRNRSSGEG